MKESPSVPSCSVASQAVRHCALVRRSSNGRGPVECRPNRESPSFPVVERSRQVQRPRLMTTTVLRWVEENSQQRVSWLSLAFAGGAAVPQRTPPASRGRYRSWNRRPACPRLRSAGAHQSNVRISPSGLTSTTPRSGDSVISGSDSGRLFCGSESLSSFSEEGSWI